LIGQRESGKPYNTVTHNESYNGSLSAGDRIMIGGEYQDHPLYRLMLHHGLSRPGIARNNPEYKGTISGHGEFRTKSGEEVEVSGRVCILKLMKAERPES